MNGDAGKGDSPRPLSVGFEEYGLNFDRIFKSGNVKPVPPPSHISIKVGTHNEFKVPADSDVETIEEKLKNMLGT